MLTITKMMRHRKLLMFALFVSLSIIPLMLNSYSADAGGPVNDPRPPKLEKSFGNWKYAVFQNNDDDAEISIGYDHRSVQSLKAFAQTNKDLAKQLQARGTTTFEALITFSRPLSLEEFNAMVRKHNLSVNTYTIRMITPNGHRWTITGSPEGGVLVPEQRLKTAKTFALTHSPDAIFAGIVDVEASFNTTQLESLHATPGIFLVDLTRTLVKQEVRQAFTKVQEAKLAVNGVHPYWFMEDLNLSNFR